MYARVDTRNGGGTMMLAFPRRLYLCELGTVVLNTNEKSWLGSRARSAGEMGVLI
jgi:hypothetical protein